MATKTKKYEVRVSESPRAQVGTAYHFARHMGYRFGHRTAYWSRRLSVKINDDRVTVEDDCGRVLKLGTIDQHAELVAWARGRAAKVDYDT